MISSSLMCVFHSFFFSQMGVVLIFFPFNHMIIIAADLSNTHTLAQAKRVDLRVVKFSTPLLLPFS